MSRSEAHRTNRALLYKVSLAHHSFYTNIMMAPWEWITALLVVVYHAPGVASLALSLGRSNGCILRACASKIAMLSGGNMVSVLALVRHTFLGSPLLFINALPNRVVV